MTASDNINTEQFKSPLEIYAAQKRSSARYKQPLETWRKNNPTPRESKLDELLDKPFSGAHRLSG